MAPLHHQHFQKPENALKRAEELLTVGQKGAALHALHDVISSRRHRTWGKTHEKIMLKYVELCVDMKRARFARDGLIQYRQVCQQVNVGSLEEVMKHYIKLATERAEKAQMEADDLKTVKDLEEITTPEELMLSYVTAESDADRHERENVMPWFKFLWETYRNCLDILKNNSKLEALYNMTAHRAFQFCKTYKRTNEFRRICETIRGHLSNLSKYKDQRDRPDLANPDTLQLYLETRFEQLKVATQLEMWQEAFRSVEDIHSLMCIVRKTPKPQMLVLYYTRLASIFQVSGAQLYHASAWFRLYNLTRIYNKSLTQTDLRVMASLVLLAALSASPYESFSQSIISQQKDAEKQTRIAVLLAFNVDPRVEVNKDGLNRASMLAELKNKGFPSIVLPEVRELYKVLEIDFRPHDLCARVSELLTQISSEDHIFASPLSASAPVQSIEVSKYVKSIQRLAALRQIQQISTVYSSVKISFLESLLIFFSLSDIELLLVNACKADFINAKIEYQNGSIIFGKLSAESDTLKNSIVHVAKRLSHVVTMIHNERPRNIQIRDNETVAKIQQISEEEHQKCLERKIVIERRKEEQERQLLKQQQEEEERKAKQQQQSLEAERKRLQLEEARREQERLTRELEEQDMEEARRMLAESSSKKKGKKVTLDADGKLDKRQIMEDALQEQIKERHENERKLLRIGRHMDHYERAKREEEAPLLQEMVRESQKVEEAEHYEKQEELLNLLKKRWQADKEMKGEILGMSSEIKELESVITARRDAEISAQRLALKERLAEQREMRKVEVLFARKREYIRLLKEQILYEKEEKRKMEEEERERKRMEKEEEEKRRREEEANRPGKFVPSWKRSSQREKEDSRGRDGERDGERDDRGAPSSFGFRDRYSDSRNRYSDSRDRNGESRDRDSRSRDRFGDSREREGGSNGSYFRGGMSRPSRERDDKASLPPMPSGVSTNGGSVGAFRPSRRREQ